MAEGHGRAAWARTSELCALIANCHRDPSKGRVHTPADYNPYEKGKRRPSGHSGIRLTCENLKSFKHLFPQRESPAEKVAKEQGAQ